MAMVIRLLGGLLLWAVGFSAIYALHGWGCELGWGTQPLLGPFTRLNLALVTLWVIVLALALIPLKLGDGEAGTGLDPTLRRVGLIGAWAGFVGLFVTGAPVLLPAHCL